MEKDFSKFQMVENMSEVTHIFKKIFDGGKSFGTDETKMGFFKGAPIIARVVDNRIEFALPFYGAMTLLVDLLENTHYNTGVT